MKRRPSKKQIEKFLNFLAQMNLSVYGPARDFDDELEYCGSMDYDMERILKAWKLRGKFKEVNY